MNKQEILPMPPKPMARAIATFIKDEDIIKNALAHISRIECREDGWSFQVGDIGGGCGYNSKLEMIDALYDTLSIAISKQVADYVPPKNDT